MFKVLSGLVSGIIITKYLQNKNQWYIYKNNKKYKLKYYDAITQLYSDYKLDKDVSMYELFEYVLDFENMKIQIETQWFELHYK